METNNANIKKPRYWLELPFEIGKAVCKEVALELDYLLGTKPPAHFMPFEDTVQPANITYIEGTHDE